MLLSARKNGYAVAALNCENMEMIQAVIAAGEEMKSPVIIQTTPSTIRYASVELFAANVAVLAKNSCIPIALHLDHGDSFDLAQNALRAGYTSIMMDGSHFPLEENIAFTKQAVDLCVNIPVEGELGHVGGKEDDVSGGNAYTDPEEAVRFVNETGVSSLAIGVGTAHGIYKTEPKLNLELISVLSKLLPIPLVLHGATGLDSDVVRDCIARGISKVNIATELRIAYTQAVRDYLDHDSNCIDPKKFNSAGREAVKKAVIDRIIICGSRGWGVI